MGLGDGGRASDAELGGAGPSDAAPHGAASDAELGGAGPSGAAPSSAGVKSGSLASQGRKEGCEGEGWGERCLAWAQSLMCLLILSTSQGEAEIAQPKEKVHAPVLVHI